MPEFSAPVLDSLRQPLETGDIVIARANAHVRYPARFQLVAAMNPCRCGYGKASGRNCGRGPNCEAAYRARVSGPIFDRMDIAVSLAPVPPSDLATPFEAEPSAAAAARVAAAREIQVARGGLNAHLADDKLREVSAPDDAGAALLSAAAEKLHLSARGYFRVLRLARTFADLDGGGGVLRRHVAEAIAMRGGEAATSTAADSPMFAPANA